MDHPPAPSGIVVLKELGLGTAFAVRIDASIVRALLIPSLMKLLGERNWWATRPMRKRRTLPLFATATWCVRGWQGLLA